MTTDTNPEMTNYELLASGATVITVDVTGRVHQEFRAEISRDTYGRLKPQKVTLTQTRTGRSCQVRWEVFNQLTRVK